MNNSAIKKRISEVWKEIQGLEVNPTNYDYYDTLLDIHEKLWKILYFKTHEEENFLLK